MYDELRFDEDLALLSSGASTVKPHPSLCNPGRVDTARLRSLGAQKLDRRVAGRWRHLFPFLSGESFELIGSYADALQEARLGQKKPGIVPGFSNSYIHARSRQASRTNATNLRVGICTNESIQLYDPVLPFHSGGFCIHWIR